MEEYIKMCAIFGSQAGMGNEKMETYYQKQFLSLMATDNLSMN